MDEILDAPAGVKGVIYVIEHLETGKKYVGQTSSHRKNKGRYRPFGAERRFKQHISEAVCNTKHKTGHCLGTDIRKYGKDAFKLTVLANCEVCEMDDLEKHYIAHFNTMHPNGYNLTNGGKGGRPKAVVVNEIPLNPSRPRGGCTSRSAETRQKMSERAKTNCTEDVKAERSTNAKMQHLAKKKERFAAVTVDHDKLDDYIHRRKGRICIDVSGIVAYFDGKTETEETLKERAREFLKILPATLSNCSGTP